MNKKVLAMLCAAACVTAFAEDTNEVAALDVVETTVDVSADVATGSDLDVVVTEDSSDASAE